MTENYTITTEVGKKTWISFHLPSANGLIKYLSVGITKFHDIGDYWIDPPRVYYLQNSTSGAIPKDHQLPFLMREVLKSDSYRQKLEVKNFLKGELKRATYLDALNLIQIYFQLPFYSRVRNLSLTD